MKLVLLDDTFIYRRGLKCEINLSWLVGQRKHKNGSTWSFQEAAFLQQPVRKLQFSNQGDQMSLYKDRPDVARYIFVKIDA
jgi:hypothetical protein